MLLHTMLPGSDSEVDCFRFEALVMSFTPRCHSSLRCINEYLATNIRGYVSIIVFPQRGCIRGGIITSRAARG